jgi:hypothetical protein
LRETYAESLARGRVRIEDADVPDPVGLALDEYLLVSAVDKPLGGDAVLVDGDHRAVLQHGLVDASQPGEIGTQDER